MDASWETAVCRTYKVYKYIAAGLLKLFVSMNVLQELQEEEHQTMLAGLDLPLQKRNAINAAT